MGRFQALRASRTRSCTSKHRHATKEDAQAHLAHLARSDGDFELRAYLCHHCGHWHIGHPPGTRAKGKPWNVLPPSWERRAAQEERRAAVETLEGLASPEALEGLANPE